MTVASTLRCGYGISLLLGLSVSACLVKHQRLGRDAVILVPEAEREELVTAIDKQTYKFQAREEALWNAALDVLMRNYNLTVVDRGSGVISTEWDSYYLGSKVYRNKVSLRISRPTYRHCQLLISNNIETLQDTEASGGVAGSSAVWLPSEDNAREIQRIVKNIAAYLDPQAAVAPMGASRR